MRSIRSTVRFFRSAILRNYPEPRLPRCSAFPKQLRPSATSGPCIALGICSPTCLAGWRTFSMTTLDSGRYDLLDQLAEEFADRYRKGERPSLKEYVDRYPDLAESL